MNNPANAPQDPANNPAAPAADPKAPANPPANDPANPPADPKAADPKANDPKNEPGKEFKIPDAYKDKPWAAKIKSEEDLYKQLDGAQELLGKKTIMPDLEKATPKEREEYYASVRPKSPEDYKFDDAATTPELKGAFGKLLFDNGISAYQGNKLIEQYNAMEAAQRNEMFSEEGFLKTLETSFGKDYKPIAAEADKILKENLSDADYAELDSKIPNQYVGIMYRFAAKIKEQYGISESGKAAAEDPSGNNPGDIKAKQTELRAKIREADKAGKFDDKARYQAELDATYGVKSK